ncbi:MAG: hypothetical protein BMS9Abin02_1671 [Anaerolineae bacterium]|nr:MAG: hypothetical protein BMS9Abin02_1671 [Anaerolineae bacterium]
MFTAQKSVKNKRTDNTETALQSTRRSHIEADLIHTIREAFDQERVFGRDEFKDKIERMGARQTRPGRSGRPRAQGAEEAAGDCYVLELYK